LARQIRLPRALTGVTDSTEVLRDLHVSGPRIAPYLAVLCENGCLRGTRRHPYSG
jgi:hypothetical protein